MRQLSCRCWLVKINVHLVEKAVHVVLTAGVEYRQQPSIQIADDSFEASPPRHTAMTEACGPGSAVLEPMLMVSAHQDQSAREDLSPHHQHLFSDIERQALTVSEIEKTDGKRPFAVTRNTLQ